MKFARILGALSVLLATVFASLPAEMEAAELEFELAKGKTLTYVVRIVEQSSDKDGVKTSTSGRTCETTYNISVAETKDNGDLVLRVSYASLKVKTSSGLRTFKFDSSQKSDDDAIGREVRKTIARPITVILSGGQIKEITGFPTAEGPDDLRARPRRLEIAMIAGSGTIRRDLQLVLACAVQGQALKKGKSYRTERTNGGRGSKTGGGREDTPPTQQILSNIVFQFERTEKNQARFSLSTRLTVRSDDGADLRLRPKETSKGYAVVSLKDGAITELKLEKRAELSIELEGQNFGSTIETTVTVKRQRARSS